MSTSHRKGSRAVVRITAFACAVAISTAACAREIGAPPVTSPVALAPRTAFEVTGPQSGCDSTDRYCGGVFGKIGGYRITYNYKSIGDGEIGAYSKTWSPLGSITQMSLWGEGNVRRGSTNHPFTLACNQRNSICADLFGMIETCAREKNSVKAFSWHHAGEPYTLQQWRGAFSTYVECGQEHESDSCENDDTRIFDDENYDPYRETDYDRSCSGSGGDNDYNPTGPYYEPGQTTGGETVDWSTGQGNGGGSVCGTTAIVDYVCIDFLNEYGEWEEWGCGYVTTC